MATSGCLSASGSALLRCIVAFCFAAGRSVPVCLPARRRRALALCLPGRSADAVRLETWSRRVVARCTDRYASKRAISPVGWLLCRAATPCFDREATRFTIAFVDWLFCRAASIPTGSVDGRSLTSTLGLRAPGAVPLCQTSLCQTGSTWRGCRPNAPPRTVALEASLGRAWDPAKGCRGSWRSICLWRCRRSRVGRRQPSAEAIAARRAEGWTGFARRRSLGVDEQRIGRAKGAVQGAVHPGRGAEAAAALVASAS
mmetsp:Transcript_30658/g.102000  ORF Transcript_30658/g.102000 Transcript_30658/m.102000 type:complete len:257 (+) Transcript_30658:1543-2313(+)